MLSPAQLREKCIICGEPLKKNKYGDEVEMPKYHKRCQKYYKMMQSLSKIKII